MASPLIHIDLFSGVGGFTLGFEASGLYRTALMVDSDYSAALTFKRNRPRARYLHRDIGKLSASELLRTAEVDAGEVDVLTAGPPCQGISRVGSRQLDDPRNQYLKKTARLIGELQPKLALIENVPALWWDEHGVLFAELAAALNDEGYDLDMRVLDAWRFGVPQLRRRLFILAARDDIDLGAEVRFPSGEQWERFNARELIRAAENGDPLCPPGLSVEEAIGDLPSISSGMGAEASAYGAGPVSPYQSARRVGASVLFNHRARSHSRDMLRKMQLIPEGGRNQELADDQRLRSSEGEYFSQAYARLHRHGIAQTMTTYFHNPGSGRFTHYRDLRSLTVREAARFQSFDDEFMFIGKAEQQMRHVGNAVPVLLAQRLAEHAAGLLSSRLMVGSNPTAGAAA